MIYKIRDFVFGFILGAILFGAWLYAGEPIAKFDDRSVSILNERLEKIEQDIRLHEARILALE